MKRIQNHSNSPFDKITTDLGFPEKFENGDTVWGFTAKKIGDEVRWYVLGRLEVTWNGLVTEIPDYVTSEFFFNEKKYTCCCPSSSAGKYRKVEIEELGYAYLPDWGGGKHVSELANNERGGPMKRIDDDFVQEQLIGIEF
tara:strand:- start:335 stop:757 length:423 start_codon:yes stop_codon:yes gene_type:complete